MLCTFLYLTHWYTCRFSKLKHFDWLKICGFWFVTLILVFWTMKTFKTLARSMFINCTFLWNTLNQIQFPFPYQCCPLQISCPSPYNVLGLSNRWSAFRIFKKSGVRSESTIRSFCSIRSIGFSELFAVRARRSVCTVCCCSILENIAARSSVDFAVHVINHVHDKILVYHHGVNWSTNQYMKWYGMNAKKTR